MGVVGLRDLFLVAPFHHSQQQQQQEDPMMPDHQTASAVNDSNAATARGVGVIPLLTAQCLAQPGVNLGGSELSHNGRANHNRNNIGNENGNGNGVYEFWQNQLQRPYSYSKKLNNMFDNNSNSTNLLQTGIGGGSVASGQMSMVATCHDCGNQSKKDCTHRRCRTCCKNRGYDCPTHVKSTWVPAARRRERMTGGGGSSPSTCSAKKPRLAGNSQTTTTSHTSNSNNTPPRSFDTSSSHQDAGFKETLPVQVRAPAVFKCVRVTAMEEGGDEFAYQAAVKIGGHVFKGFLYDQGLHARGSGDDDHYPNTSVLHLGGGSGGSGGGRNNGASSSSPMLDVAADVFLASSGPLLGGSTVGYGNQMN